MSCCLAAPRKDRIAAMASGAPFDFHKHHWAVPSFCSASEDADEHAPSNACSDDYFFN